MTNRFAKVVSALVLLALWQGPLSSRALAQRSDLKEFVRTHYYHGLPAEQARRFGPEATPVLIEMLRDEQEREAWPNIVRMLGLLENPAASQPLIDFLENRFDGTVDDTTYRALVLAPGSLGMIARGPDSKPQKYLMTGLTREVWQERRLSWTYPTLTPDDRSILMVKLSAGGVGVIGTPGSLKALEDLRDRLTTTPGRFQQSVLPSVQDAILVNRIIQEDGRKVLFDEQLPLRLEQERRKTRQ